MAKVAESTIGQLVSAVGNCAVANVAEHADEVTPPPGRPEVSSISGAVAWRPSERLTANCGLSVSEVVDGIGVGRMAKRHRRFLESDQVIVPDLVPRRRNTFDAAACMPELNTAST